jgi:lipopolysaccharide transport system ATP-binding protein
MNGPVISLENISKEYRLGIISTNTLRGDFERWVARIRGKEDPALIVSQSNALDQKSDAEYVWALKDVNLEIFKGDVIGIIGKNGAGKSTLLKLVSRVTTPTTGIIKIKGRIASMLEVGTGFHPELTGRENIFLNGAILGMTKKEIVSKLEEIVSFSGIEKYIDTPVKRYSSGMYVRLAFAVAAHLDPEILIIDEVLAVGDAEFHKKAIQKMKEVSQGEGRAVLFVSHNMSAIKHLCNKAILLKEGKIFYTGEVDDTIDKYQQMSSVKSNKRATMISDDHRIKLQMPCWINSKDEKVNYFTFGERICLRFEFEFITPVAAINPGIAIVRLDGQRVFTSHLLDDPDYKKPEVYKDKMIIDTEFNILTLAPGMYSVIFGVRDEMEHTIIYSEDELFLEIGHVVLKNAGYGVLWHTTKWINKTAEI